MYERVEECPICQHTEFSNYIICSDHLVTDESFAIVQCNSCSLKFTNPRPTAENIHKYYESSAYDSHKKKGSGLTDSIYNVARKFALNGKLNLINSLQTDKGKLLDVGCGTGLFLDVCAKDGWSVVGVENNENAKLIAKSNSQALIVDDINALEKKKEFDIITLWHVLEHLHDLTETLKNLKRILRKNGSLIIAVPNCDSWDSTYYKEMWAAYDVPRHLYHFNQLTINKLAKEYEFKVKEVLPMKLDAFYVSLLSEKYKHGMYRFLKAFTSGLKSNRWAKKKQNNYSSLIYILSKK